MPYVKELSLYVILELLIALAFERAKNTPSKYKILTNVYGLKNWFEIMMAV